MSTFSSEVGGKQQVDLAPKNNDQQASIRLRPGIATPLVVVA